jgi:hypothetical protein
VIIIYSLDAPKSILETGKTLKTLSSGQIYLKKKNKKTKKNQKKQKKTKKPLGWFFLNGFFPTLPSGQPWSSWRTARGA